MRIAKEAPKITPLRQTKVIFRLPVCENYRMREIEELASRIARSNVSILIAGESGVGKELVGQIIHARSSRAAKKFIAVNVSAYPNSLLETELFGHAKGAYTGAGRDRKGLFQRAHGGTLFLDEIGDISPGNQVKMLRALEEGVVYPVGSDKSEPADVRIIVATNQDLAKKMQEGLLREDFFYRIAGMQIEIPPLRERLEDIIPLAEYFLSQEAEKMRMEIPRISQEARKFLICQNWRGNVRQLKSILTLALLFAEEGEVGVDALNFVSRGIVPTGDSETTPGPKTLVELKMYEKAIIYKALEEAGWNRGVAARTLGIPYRSLRYRIGKFKIIK